MRASIRQEIARIAPTDVRESEAQRAALEWVDSGAELCRLEKPARPPQHLVSYFALVDGDYVLLVDHINAGLWLPTGGHVEPGEHPRDTVRREAFEELGLPADFVSDEPLFLTITDTVGRTAGHTDVSLWYVLRGDRRNPIRFDRSEFRAASWFHREDIPFQIADPELGRFVGKLYATAG